MRHSEVSKKEAVRAEVKEMQYRARVNARYMGTRYEDRRFRWRNWIWERDKKRRAYFLALLEIVFNNLNFNNVYICEYIHYAKEKGWWDYELSI